MIVENHFRLAAWNHHFSGLPDPSCHTCKIWKVLIWGATSSIQWLVGSFKTFATWSTCIIMHLQAIPSNDEPSGLLMKPVISPLLHLGTYLDMNVWHLVARHGHLWAHCKAGWNGWWFQRIPEFRMCPARSYWDLFDGSWNHDVNHVEKPAAHLFWWLPSTAWRKIAAYCGTSALTSPDSWSIKSFHA